MKARSYGQIFAARLKQERERLGLSRKGMAEFLGLYPSTYSGIENGNLCGSSVFIDIALKLNISMDYLVGLTEERRDLHDA